MPNPQKIEAVKELSEKFSKAKGIYLTDFTHLTVDEAVEFRKRLREKGIEYKVAKNSLINIAAGEANLTGFSEYLVGPTGLVLSYEDATSPAKIIYDFSKEYDKMKVKACWFDGELFGADKFAEIAKLPSRNELLSRLIGDFQSPMRTLAATLQASMSKMVGVLTSLKENKEE